MVLKKTNSPFNTGTTQRLCDRGAYLYVGPHDNENVSMSIQLDTIPSIYNPLNSSVQHAKALNKLYTHLQFDGPALEDFYKLRIYRWPTRQRKIIDLSSNTKDFWNLPEKIDRLLADDEFLKNEIDVAEVHVCKTTYVANTGRVYRKQERIFGRVCDETKQSTPAPKCRKLKKQKHSRGVQRPYLFNAMPNEENDEDRPHPPIAKKVILNVVDFDHFDARTARSPGRDYMKYGVKQSKSRTKRKGRVNGRGSISVKGYDKAQIRLYTNYPAECLHDYEDYTYNTLETDPMEDEIPFTHRFETSESKLVLNIEENAPFLRKKRRSELKQAFSQIEKSSKETNTIRMENVNPASSQKTIRHEKGSFQFIQTPFSDEFTKEEKASTGDFVFVSIDDLDEQYMENEVKTSTVPQSTSLDFDSINITLDSGLFSSQDTFVTVNLDLPQTFFETSTKCTLYVKDCPIIFGNCSPPAFKLLIQNADLQMNHEWYILTTSQCQPSKSNTWRISLKCSQVSDNVERLKNLVISRLQNLNEKVLTLDGLIGEVTTIINDYEFENNINEIHSNAKRDKNECPNTTPANDRYYNTHNALSSNTSYKILDSINTIQELNSSPNDSGVQESVTQIAEHQELKHSDTNISSECDICCNSFDTFGAMNNSKFMLQPCKHAYCYECWQSHIFHQAKSGNLIIKCMHTECQEVLNDVVLNVFISDIDMNRLVIQLNERKIDSNPRCTWCPRTSCNKLALLNENQNLKTIGHFGHPILCECNFSWCFSCQSNPHFPASCSQALVHKTLLSKFRYSFPQSVVHCVKLKPCPGCKYPIEKNEGCPHMTCSMCLMGFCWKCLQPVSNHVVWKCTADESSNFTNYHLVNEVVNNFPLKYFDKSVDIFRRHAIFRRQHILNWIHSALILEQRRDEPMCRLKPKHSFNRSLNGEHSNGAKLKAILMVTEIVDFLTNCLSFLENFYMLLSFAELNTPKTQTMKQGESSATCYFYLSNKLNFIASRLEEIISTKSVNRLVVAHQSCRLFLNTGREIKDTLTKQVPTLQRRSLKIDPEPYGLLDPTKYFTYR